MTKRVESGRFPYLSMTLEAGGSRQTVDAVLDTGFDGDLAVPPALATGFRAVRGTFLEWGLSDAP